MKHSILTFLVIGIAMILFSCSENNPTGPEFSQSDQISTTFAKKSLAKFVGEMDLTFDFLRAPYFWQGTVDFGNNEVYGIRFESLGPPMVYGQSSHFEENFEIFELGNTDNVYLKGPDAGVISLKNSKFRANGEVTLANAPFTMWNGTNAHFNGIITEWGTDGFPVSGNGTFRIN